MFDGVCIHTEIEIYMFTIGISVQINHVCMTTKDFVCKSACTKCIFVQMTNLAHQRVHTPELLSQMHTCTK